MIRSFSIFLIASLVLLVSGCDKFHNGGYPKETRIPSDGEFHTISGNSNIPVQIELYKKGKSNYVLFSDSEIINRDTVYLILDNLTVKAVYNGNKLFVKSDSKEHESYNISWLDCNDEVLINVKTR